MRVFQPAPSSLLQRTTMSRLDGHDRRAPIRGKGSSGRGPRAAWTSLSRGTEHQGLRLGGLKPVVAVSLGRRLKAQAKEPTEQRSSGPASRQNSGGYGRALGCQTRCASSSEALTDPALKCHETGTAQLELPRSKCSGTDRRGAGFPPASVDTGCWARVWPLSSFDKTALARGATGRTSTRRPAAGSPRRSRFGVTLRGCHVQRR